MGWGGGGYKGWNKVGKYRSLVEEPYRRAVDVLVGRRGGRGRGGRGGLVELRSGVILRDRMSGGKTDRLLDGFLYPALSDEVANRRPYCVWRSRSGQVAKVVKNKILTCWPTYHIVGSIAELQHITTESQLYKLNASSL